MVQVEGGKNRYYTCRSSARLIDSILYKTNGDTHREMDVRTQ